MHLKLLLIHLFFSLSYFLANLLLKLLLGPKILLEFANFQLSMQTFDPLSLPPIVMTWARMPRSSEKEGSTKVSQFIFYKQQAVLPSQVSKTLRERPLAATTNTELSPTHTWTCLP